MSDTYDVDVVRKFDAPLSRVWAAWTEPGDLRQWWGPTGFTWAKASGRQSSAS
jgi:uncharacterized protein YndB with AHSA1/START domain